MRAAAIDDAPALRQALLGAEVVINCAGPFTFYGAPVIEAALDVGAHYCDTTGEQPYMKGVFECLDEPARSRGLAVVPGVGFDYVPGDLACALAADGHRAGVVESTSRTRCAGFGATRGTMHSALEMLGGGDVEYVGGVVAAGRAAAAGRDVRVPAPLGEQVVARYPAGEVVTVPQPRRHPVGARADHGAVVRADRAADAASCRRSRGSCSAPLLRTPLSDLCDAVIDRLPEGPSEEDRRASAFTVVADAHGADGATARVVVEGHDVYGITAVMAVEFARRMADDGFGVSGALAPAQAVDPEDFLGFLGEHGVSHRVERPASREPTART